jgi:hypothetical protein
LGPCFYEVISAEPGDAAGSGWDVVMAAFHRAPGNPSPCVIAAPTYKK